MLYTFNLIRFEPFRPTGNKIEIRLGVLSFKMYFHLSPLSSRQRAVWSKMISGGIIHKSRIYTVVRSRKMR